MQIDENLEILKRIAHEFAEPLYLKHCIEIYVCYKKTLWCSPDKNFLKKELVKFGFIPKLVERYVEDIPNFNEKFKKWLILNP